MRSPRHLHTRKRANAGICFLERGTGMPDHIIACLLRPTGSFMGKRCQNVQLLRLLLFRRVSRSCAPSMHAAAHSILVITTHLFLHVHVDASDTNCANFFNRRCSRSVGHSSQPAVHDQNPSPRSTHPTHQEVCPLRESAWPRCPSSASLHPLDLRSAFRRWTAGRRIARPSAPIPASVKERKHVGQEGAQSL